MTQPPSDLFTRYQRWRPYVEVGFWFAFFFMQGWFNSWHAVNNLQRLPPALRTIEPWQQIIHIGASNVVLFMWVPLVLAFERRFPLRWGTLVRHLQYHFLATIVYSVTHVVAMVALYDLLYLPFDSQYVVKSWPKLLGYQYLKDFRTYFFVIVILYFYRLVLMRLQGEAKLLDTPEDGPPMEPIERPERFLVRKRGKEFLLPAMDIEWIQASGNYINLRVRGHDYLLRSTMAAIETRLEPKKFVRVHRSYIANLDHIRTLEHLESGDARASMSDSSQVPVSRRYLDQLRQVSTI